MSQYRDANDFNTMPPELNAPDRSVRTMAKTESRKQ